MKSTVPYLREEDVQAIALPYGQQEQNLRMYLFRPNGNISLKDWIQYLSDLGMGIAFDSKQADFSTTFAQGRDTYLSVATSEVCALCR